MKARSRDGSSSTSRRSTSTQRPIRSLRGAAAWLDRVGIGALLPGAELVLPSLWEAIAGTREVTWGTVDAHGRNVFTPEMARCWAWKDELPAQKLGLVGKHFGRWAALVAPRMLPPLYALTGRAGARRRLSQGGARAGAARLCEAVLDAGPSTGPELRALMGADKKTVDAAIVVLQRAFVLTNAHVVEQSSGWAAIAVDLVARRWRPERLPAVAAAQRDVVQCVLASSGELSAADLGGALGWRVKRSREALDELVELGCATRRLEAGLALYAAG